MRTLCEETLQHQTGLGVDNLQDLDVLTAEWDLLIEIQNTLRQIQGVKLKHIKGHQDKTGAYRSLSILAQLNVDADDKAREYRREHGKAHLFY